MRRLIYTPAARAALGEIYLYIRQQSASRAIAASFIATLRQQCAKLASYQGTLGVARPELVPDLRFLPFGNYAIFFRYRDEVLEIVAILETHRDVESYFTPD